MPFDYRSTLIRTRGNISAAAGPIGTGGQIQASLAHPAPMFSYSRSKGLFAGISLEGTALVERKDANRDFYGSAISAKDILSGRVPAPEIASRMYDIIEGTFCETNKDTADSSHSGRRDRRVSPSCSRLRADCHGRACTCPYAGLQCWIDGLGNGPQAQDGF